MTTLKKKNKITGKQGKHEWSLKKFFVFVSEVTSFMCKPVYFPAIKKDLQNHFSLSSILFFFLKIRISYNIIMFVSYKHINTNFVWDHTWPQEWFLWVTKISKISLQKIQSSLNFLNPQKLRNRRWEHSALNA